MWLIAEFEATALYSLKLSTATSSGGKTLLAPTPYALKMALLDVAWRARGTGWAEEVWPTLRDLRVAYQPPERAVVTNLFTKILKPNRNPPEPGAPDSGPLGKSIGYREYVQFAGPLGMALATGSGEPMPEWLRELEVGLQYLGKRGGFVQLLDVPRPATRLPDGYVPLNAPDGQATFDSRGLLQMLDDCGPNMTLRQADIYSGEGVRVGKERILRPTVLPYRVARASKSYTLYERLT